MNVSKGGGERAGVNSGMLHGLLPIVYEDEGVGRRGMEGIGQVDLPVGAEHPGEGVERARRKPQPSTKRWRP